MDVDRSGIGAPLNCEEWRGAFVCCGASVVDVQLVLYFYEFHYSEENIALRSSNRNVLLSLQGGALRSSDLD